MECRSLPHSAAVDLLRIAESFSKEFLNKIFDKTFTHPHQSSQTVEILDLREQR
jgi:hypothetical protein